MSQIEQKEDGSAHPEFSKMTLSQLFADKAFQSQFSGLLDEYSKNEKNNTDDGIIGTVMNSISSMLNSACMGTNLMYFVPKFKEQQSKLSLLPDLSKAFNIDFKNVVKIENLDWEKVYQLMECPCESLKGFAKSLKDKFNPEDTKSFQKYVCEKLNDYKSWFDWDIKTISNGLLCASIVCQLVTIGTTIRQIYKAHSQTKVTTTLQKLIDHKLNNIRTTLESISTNLRNNFKLISTSEQSMKRIVEKLEKCDAELSCIIETILNEKEKTKTNRNKCVGSGVTGMIAGVTGLINSGSLISLGMVNPGLGILAIALGIVQTGLGAYQTGQGAYIHLYQLEEWNRLEKKAKDTLDELKKIQDSNEFKEIEKQINTNEIRKEMELNIIKNAFEENDVDEKFFNLIIIKKKYNTRRRLIRIDDDKLIKWGIGEEVDREDILETIELLCNNKAKNNADNATKNYISSLCNTNTIVNTGIAVTNLSIAAMSVHKMMQGNPVS